MTDFPETAMMNNLQSRTSATNEAQHATLRNLRLDKKVLKRSILEANRSITGALLTKNCQKSGARARPKQIEAEFLVAEASDDDVTRSRHYM